MRAQRFNRINQLHHEISNIKQLSNTAVNSNASSSHMSQILRVNNPMKICASCQRSMSSKYTLAHCMQDAAKFSAFKHKIVINELNMLSQGNAQTNLDIMSIDKTVMISSLESPPHPQALYFTLPCWASMKIHDNFKQLQDSSQSSVEHSIRLPWMFFNTFLGFLFTVHILTIVLKQ